MKLHTTMKDYKGKVYGELTLHANTGVFKRGKELNDANRKVVSGMI